MSFYRNPIALLVQAALAAITVSAEQQAKDPTMDWAMDPTARFTFRTFEHEGEEHHRITMGGGRCVVLTIPESYRGNIEAAFFRRQLAYEMMYHNVTSAKGLMEEDIIRKQYEDMNLYENDGNIQANYSFLAAIIWEFLNGGAVKPHSLKELPVAIPKKETALDGFMEILQLLLNTEQQEDFAVNPPRTNLLRRASAITVEPLNAVDNNDKFVFIRSSVISKTVVIKDIDLNAGSFSVEYFSNQYVYKNTYKGGHTLISYSASIDEPVKKKYADLRIFLAANLTAFAKEVYSFLFQNPKE